MLRGPLQVVGTAILCAVLVLLPEVSVANTYPAKPVKILVGWAPGGGVDVTARLIAQKLSSVWGQQVIVENRPGAGGNLAADLAAKSAPDGYTLFLGTTGELAVNATLFRSLPYHPVRDFSHIAMAVRVPMILAMHPSVPAKDVRALVDYSKSQPNGLTYASPGNGSIGHLTAELLKSATGAKLLHIPYKGAAPATADLVGGQVQMGFSSLPAVLPHVQAGRLKAIAVTTEGRVEAAPELPTISESGFPGLSAFGWYAFVGPAGMPQAMVDKLNRDISEVVSDPEVKSKLEPQGLESWTMPPRELRDYFGAEIARWQKVVNAAGIKVD
jgi:tripartite-type tricarboxylate transporter receptor subunit TctC